jgi:hypothetical protein
MRIKTLVTIDGATYKVKWGRVEMDWNAARNSVTMSRLCGDRPVLDHFERGKKYWTVWYSSAQWVSGPMPKEEVSYTRIKSAVAKLFADANMCVDFLAEDLPDADFDNTERAGTMGEALNDSNW